MKKFFQKIAMSSFMTAIVLLVVSFIVRVVKKRAIAQKAANSLYALSIEELEKLAKDEAAGNKYLDDKIEEITKLDEIELLKKWQEKFE